MTPIATHFGQQPPTRRAKNIARHVAYRRRAFAVVGPTVWNSLGSDLRDPDLMQHRQLRSVAYLRFMFQQYSVHRTH